MSDLSGYSPQCVCAFEWLEPAEKLESGELQSDLCVS